MNKPKKQYDAIHALAVNATAKEFGVTAIYVRQQLSGKWPISDNGKKMIARVQQLKNKLNKIIN